MLSGIISKLKGIQVREGLSDGDMAERLGCSRQLYQGTRTGRTPLGNKILKGITAAFPDLEQDVVIYFLSSDASKLPNNAKNPPRQPSKAQGRGWKGFFRDLLWRIKKGVI